MDGHTVLRYASDVFADTIVSFARSITKDTHGAEYMEPVVGKGTFFKAAPPTPLSTSVATVDWSPKKMDFELNIEHIKDIHYSETSISDQVLQNVRYLLMLQCLAFPRFVCFVTYFSKFFVILFFWSGNASLGIPIFWQKMDQKPKNQSRCLCSMCPMHCLLHFVR